MFAASKHARRRPRLTAHGLNLHQSVPTPSARRAPCQGLDTEGSDSMHEITPDDPPAPGGFSGNPAPGLSCTVRIAVQRASSQPSASAHRTPVSSRPGSKRDAGNAQRGKCSAAYRACCSIPCASAGLPRLGERAVSEVFLIAPLPAPEVAQETDTAHSKEACA
jgi:hypothetical protein